jgi:hypothetical protein
MRKMILTLAALAALSIAPSVYAQEVDLVCGPVADDSDSITRSNLPIHIRLGDKPEIKLWDGTRPDFIGIGPVDINFNWKERDDGKMPGGLLNRQTGMLVLNAVADPDHFKIAQCLPVKRLF